MFALATAAWLIYVANQRAETVSAQPLVSLTEARRIFPDAERLGPNDAQRNAQTVLKADGTPLGWVLKTSPETDDLIGYAGPSNLLVGIDSQGRIVRAELLWSKDTVVHVNAIRRDLSFWNQFAGRQAANESAPHIEAVSGSTLTSLAMAEAVQRRLGGEALSFRFAAPIALDEVRAVFRDAVRLQANDPRPGWQRVLGTRDQTLGFAIRTSPQADNAIGYQGPTDLLLAIGVDEQSVTAVRLRTSYDTPEYVARVRDEGDYLKQLAGRSLAEWADMDFRATGIEGVSGATQTSFAMADGIRRRARAERDVQRTASSAPRLRLRDWSLLSIVIGALVIGFSPLKRYRVLRWAWQLVLIAGFGLWLGDLLSLSLLAGWARHGVPWRTAPAVAGLTAVALLAPWGTKRQVYCHHLCPHGAAQEWLGRFSRCHVHLPRSVARPLGFAPAVLLAVACLLAIAAPRFDLSLLEPFDAWVLKGSAAISLAIAIGGLVASCFVPMAYCRFGCPTGALLKFVRSHGSNERFSGRDWAALSLLVAGAFLVFGSPRLDLMVERREEQNGTRSVPATIGGDAFGTTWSVNVRAGSASDRSLPDASVLRTRIAARLEQIERQLSHWRPDSDTAQFNSSATTLEMECSPDLVFLVDFAAKLSRATNGAFDITVGPLVNAWGYGPSGPRPEPSGAEIAALLESAGWQKIVIDRQFNLLQKLHSNVQIDLGALLQGYAADRLAELLDAAGVVEYLINVGGELRCRGEWTVAVENPRNATQPLRTIQLQDAALATSGTYRKSPNGEARTRHIISTKTGRPIVSKWQLCAVMDRTGIEADGWATALLASDPEQTLAIAERERIAALLVDDAGNVVTTPAFDREGKEPRTK